MADAPRFSSDSAEETWSDSNGEEDEEEMDELERQMAKLDVFIGKKNTGALTTHTITPYTGLSRVSAHADWVGDELESSFSGDRNKGFVAVSHAAFGTSAPILLAEVFFLDSLQLTDLYKRKKYIKTRDSGYHAPDSEDYVLLDPESHVKFESATPGAVSVEGFGLECWHFEETKPRTNTTLVNSSDLPTVNARQLLRRLNEMQTNPGRFGWRPATEELDLKEFVGSLGIVYYDQKYARDPNRWIGDLYSVLNRSDIFADFVTESSVGLQWADEESGESIGIWYLLRQVVLGRELAVRLEHLDSGTSYTGFTERILATLIISDLWVKHVKMVLTEQKLAVESLQTAETAAERDEAEEFIARGDDALNVDLQEAVDYYTDAIKIDLRSAAYRCKRSAVLITMGEFEAAEEDAFIATQLDPQYATAWCSLGAAILKQGEPKRAKEAYERGLRVVGKEATDELRQGLAEAQRKTSEAVNAINAELDQEKQHSMRVAFLNQDWSISCKVPELHSLVHEQQVEGLLLFADRIKWPFITEVREYAEDAYSNLRGGATININLHDWLYGLTLPGKWFSLKIINALVQCTPSIRDQAGEATYFDCGLSLPNRSYWRARTVLGRVLGALPGMTSLCGWVGPCPRVDFDPPSTPATQPRFIRLQARLVAPTYNNHTNDDDEDDHNAALEIQPGEDLDTYTASIQSPTNWIIPPSPPRTTATYTLQSITLSRPSTAPEEDPYRATLTFHLPATNTTVSYKLYTNPVFVSLPPCKPGPDGPAHKVHVRERGLYENIWSVEQLKEYDDAAAAAGDDLDYGAGGTRKGVMVINATGHGGEVVARAWCAERGRNAVVVRGLGRPCFACAVKAAGAGGLGVGVVIWC